MDNHIHRTEIELLKLLKIYTELSMNEICFFLKVNTNSSKNAIDKLSKFLKVYGLGEIVYENKKFILHTNINKLTNFDIKLKKVYLDSKARFYYIIILLVFEKKITLLSLIEVLDVTMNTLILDLNKIKYFLKRFNLKVSSIPFTGISLEGSRNAKIKFTMKILLKYMIEEELHPIASKLYGIYVNPLIRAYLKEKLKGLNLNKVNQIANSVVKNLKIDSDMYFYITLKTIISYFFIEKQDCFFIDGLKFKGRKQEIYLELVKIFNIKDKSKVNILIFALVITIYRHESNHTTRYLKKNYLFNTLTEKIERTYKIKLSSIENNELFDMVNKFEYKILFDVTSYDNNYISSSDIPKSILADIGYLLNKNKLTIKKEDLYIIALYIYYTVTNYYMNNNFIKNILIVDYSIHNWLGRGFMRELKKYLPGIKSSF